MGFLDFLRGNKSGKHNYNYNNESDSNYEYDDDEFDDNEYYDDESSDNNYSQYIEISDYKTRGIYSFEDSYEEWEWECNNVNYPNRSFDPWKTIEDKLYNYDEEDAEQYLKNYFRGETKDVTYYFAMAYIHLQKTDSYDTQFEDIQRAKSHIENAANNCNDDPIWLALINHLKEHIGNWYSRMKEEKRLREDFQKEWAALIYRTRYSNMDTNVPLLRNLAQSIRHQLSKDRGSREFLETVETDLNTWISKYATAKAEEFLQNGDVDEAAKMAPQITEESTRTAIYSRIIEHKLQNGNLDEASKIAIQVKDMSTQTIITARIAIHKLQELLNNGYSSSTAIDRQLLLVNDTLRRASTLSKDKEIIHTLEREVQEIMDKQRNGLWNATIKSPTTTPQQPIGRASSSISTYSDPASESEYLEELKTCYEDGIISDKELRLLSRLRKSLGISEARAVELEAMCRAQLLTPEEQEYADEVRTCLEEDGVITDKERRLLGRIAKSLGITSERAIEIEHMIK